MNKIKIGLYSRDQFLLYKLIYFKLYSISQKTDLFGPKKKLKKK